MLTYVFGFNVRRFQLKLIAITKNDDNDCTTKITNKCGVVTQPPSINFCVPLD